LEELKEKLQTIKDLLINDHQSLFLDEVEEFIGRVDVFGFYFASLDIRQDSRVHHTAFSQLLSDAKSSGVTLMKKEYSSMTEQEKMKVLPSLVGDLSLDLFQDDLVKKTLGSIRAMKQIQRSNGEKGCNRYIISNNQSALNVLEVFAMIRLSDWEVPSVDIAPLFETVPDLEVAPDVMDAIYSDPTYRAHLERRGNKQTIMLGFSDGTKDGGYLMANWSIYKAKENLSRISRKHGIKVLFFDGRGGPPARGGGNTHQFYASLGNTIESDEIQLTVQGQTISSNFGTIDSCQYNLEQLLSAGITNKVFSNDSESLSKEDRKTMDKLAKISYQVYSDFKSHPCFIPYLERMSTLKYYAKTNIGSRPSKRGKSEGLNFSDLRAIPFVGSWSQLKQNVPGFYGVGSALQEFVEAGNFKEVKSLYQNSAFFRTLLSNSMMSLTKSFFKLTAYMQNDPEFGDFWKLIYEEYKLTKSLLLKLSGYNTLMEDQPAGKASIMVRENIVLPLLTIQQYALQTIQKMEAEGGHSKKELLVFEKMVTRSLFGNINASRNSA
jgi:phosphoenolpyruvate carboxylase